jgi:hypothetical protein
MEESHCVFRRIVIGIRIRFCLNDLNGYLPVNTRVLSKVNLTHSSLPDLTNQAISPILQLF